MADIEVLLDRLLAKEGGFVDDPADTGGVTNLGITEQVARAAGWQGPMRDLPGDLARAIYRGRYWTGPGFDTVAAVAPMLAAELFDTGVNMGPGVAAGFVQRVLNALNRQQADWPDIPVDQRIGPATIAALKALLRVRGPQGEAVAVRAVNALQAARYIAIAEARPVNERFLYGWLANRT